MAVDEFTVAVAYEQRGTGSDAVSQLVEHTWGGNEWFLETRYDGSHDRYGVEYAVAFPTATVASAADYELGGRQVAVGTYDGDEYELYVDGTRVASGTHTRSVDMGDVRLGRDFESTNQYLDGDICEVRLYHTAFDGDEVGVVTDVMSR